MFSILLNLIIGLSFALGVPIGGGVLRHRDPRTTLCVFLDERPNRHQAVRGSLLRHKREPIGLDFHLDKRDASAMKHAMEDFQSAGPWSPWN